MTPWLTRHPLASYFILTYAISWSIAVPLALQAQGIIETHLSPALHYVTMFGPALAALCMIGLLSDTLSGTRARARRSRRWKWWTIGFTSPLAMFAAAQVVGRLAGQPTPTWTTLGHVNFLPDLGLFAWCLWFACGTGEEIGWRGFLLPRLQRRHSPLASSGLLAIGWAGWHLPAFFYLPSYSAIGLALLPGFFIGILSGAIVLTWLYNRSGGSVLAAAFWHASFNFVSASPTAAGLAAAATSMLVVGWAVVLLITGALTNSRDSLAPHRAAVKDAA